MEVFVASWNVGNTKVEPAEIDAWLRGTTRDASLVIIALQEAHYLTDEGRESIRARAAVASTVLGSVFFCVGCFVALPLLWKRRREKRAREKHARLERELLMNPALQKTHVRALVCVDAVTRLVTCLEDRGFNYEEEASVSWGQLRLLVFARPELELEALKTAVAATGGKVTNNDMNTGVLGNKGGLVSSFSVVLGHEKVRRTVTAIGCHLPAHEGAQRRVERFEALGTILEKAKNDARLGDSDLAVLAGDLNFRLDTDEAAEDVAAAIGDGEHEQFYKYDELERGYAALMPGWELPRCEFPPTFKVRKGQIKETYNTKRIPAWCDRVLFKSPLGTHVVNWASYPRVTTSDHKPVALTLDILNKPKTPKAAPRALPPEPARRTASSASDDGGAYECGTPRPPIDALAVADADVEIRVLER